MKRPTANGLHGSVVTTPRAAAMLQLLGGPTYRSNAFTQDEFRAINKLYGFTPEKPNEKPPPPAAPKREDFDSSWKYEEAVRKHVEALKAHDRWEDSRPMMQAGADRNAIRHAESDGLRLLAWIAKHVPDGEDPLKTLIQACTDAGWEVDPSDIEWAESDAFQNSADDVEKA